MRIIIVSILLSLFIFGTWFLYRFNVIAKKEGLFIQSKEE